MIKQTEKEKIQNKRFLELLRSSNEPIHILKAEAAKYANQKIKEKRG